LKNSFHRIALLSLASLFFSASVHATLWDRQGGLIYDDVLDVTWVQDVHAVQNYYNGERAVDWATATSWVENFEYYDTARDMVWDDWRLPTIDSGAYAGWDPVYDSNAAVGKDQYYVYDRSEAGANEMAYMYYVNLGFQANNDLTSDPADLLLPTSTNGAANPFENLYYLGTWTGSLVGNPDRPDQVWYFHFHFGRTLSDPNGLDTQTVWAVRDGDVGLPSAVPVPPALWLMGSSLVLFGFVNKRHKTSVSV
jgi:hypothetical protein